MKNDKNTKNCAYRFLNEMANFDEAVETLLEKMAVQFDLDKAAVFECTGDKEKPDFARTYFWSVPGVPVTRSAVHVISWAQLKLLEPDLDEKKYLAVDDCANHPMNRLVVDYRKMRVKAVLYCIITYEGEKVGAVMFSDCKRTRNWEEEGLEPFLKFAELLGNRLMLHKNKQKTKTEVERHLECETMKAVFPFFKFEKQAEAVVSRHPERSYYISYYHIDNMKYVNDAYGFQAGNHLIRQLSDFLQSYLTGTEFLGTMAGNEFIALREQKGDLDEVSRIVSERLHEFCRYQEKRYGIAHLNIKCGICDIDRGSIDIFRNMDCARSAYCSIRELDGCLCKLYDDELRKLREQQCDIYMSMHGALRNDEFEVCYQPKWKLSDGSLCGMEALIRWNRADGSRIAPDIFIPQFEKNGFIEKLDEYVLKKVLQDLTEWKEEGLPLYPVSINLSGKNVQNPLFIDRIIYIARNSSVLPDYLEFELTETFSQGEIEHASDALMRLKREGFRISLDDFGSGYSSLGVLLKLPLDVIKIDRGFLYEMEKGGNYRVLLKNMIRTLNEMGYDVLCEGIETEAQYRMLKEMGCQKGQGYYYSRPLSKAALEERFLKNDQDSQQKSGCLQHESAVPPALPI